MTTRKHNVTIDKKQLEEKINTESHNDHRCTQKVPTKTQPRGTLNCVAKLDLKRHKMNNTVLFLCLSH